MRPRLIVLVALLVSACGILPGAGSPPTLSLTSANGVQEAVPGSYCLTGRGRGECADYPAVHPREVSVVAAGDSVSLVIDGGTFVRSQGCFSDDEQDCIGSMIVRPLGCDGPADDSVPLALGRETRWTVDLEPGAYQLDVFGYFESFGASGDVSGSLGLVVQDRADGQGLGVSPVEASLPVCRFDLASD